ncbi:hypothetical protein GPA19_24720 [Azoarcus indigens]|uniref:hypothetical protein n=1 Tax=Azoarcus indigens TaxID=29545 RepID=UPI0013C2B3FA|nr:hypothetical protein [Azoarcus indigens]NMG68137.1 hypothetical protein [Azoarcus indigens]
MITRWYIEARSEENWLSVSNLFGAWLDKNASLQSFGFSEGDAIEHSGITFLCFKFPARHGENIALFPLWAKGTGRLFGGAENGTVRLSNGEEITLPPEPGLVTPSWLK